MSDPHEPDSRIVYVRFFAKVDNASIGNLITTVEEKLGEGFKRFMLLISSPGGKVSAGLTGYNFFKGIPAEVQTFNLGNADSIAAVLYCAGVKRYCVPQGRFLLHGVTAHLPGGAFDEKSLNERVKGLQSDRLTISEIIARTCHRPLEAVEHDMLQGTVLNAREAMAYGLVHEIREQIFESGATIVSVPSI